MPQELPHACSREDKCACAAFGTKTNLKFKTVAAHLEPRSVGVVWYQQLQQRRQQRLPLVLDCVGSRIIDCCKYAVIISKRCWSEQGQQVVHHLQHHCRGMKHAVFLKRSWLAHTCCGNQHGRQCNETALITAILHSLQVGQTQQVKRSMEAPAATNTASNNQQANRHDTELIAAMYVCRQQVQATSRSTQLLSVSQVQLTHTCQAGCKWPCHTH